LIPADRSAPGASTKTPISAWLVSVLIAIVLRNDHCPSPEVLGYQPLENFGMKDACRRVLEHFRNKHQHILCAYFLFKQKVEISHNFLILPPPPEDFRDTFCVAGGAFGRPWPTKALQFTTGVFHLTNRNRFWIHRISYSICKTETGSDQTLQTGFGSVYCMKIACNELHVNFSIKELLYNLLEILFYL